MQVRKIVMQAAGRRSTAATTNNETIHQTTHHRDIAEGWSTATELSAAERCGTELHCRRGALPGNRGGITTSSSSSSGDGNHWRRRPMTTTTTLQQQQQEAASSGTAHSSRAARSPHASNAYNGSMSSARGTPRNCAPPRQVVVAVDPSTIYSGGFAHHHHHHHAAAVHPQQHELSEADFCAAASAGAIINSHLRRLTDAVLDEPNGRLDLGKSVMVIDEVSTSTTGSNSPVNCIQVLYAIRSRFSGPRDSAKIFLGLELVEMCVKNCGLSFARHIDDSFMAAMLRLLKMTTFKERTIANQMNKAFQKWVVGDELPAVPTDPRIHRMKSKVLFLIQLWADSFMLHQDSVPSIHAAYRKLRSKGVKFPLRDARQKFLVKNAEDSPAFDLGIQQVYPEAVGNRILPSASPPPGSARRGQGSVSRSGSRSGSGSGDTEDYRYRSGTRCDNEDRDHLSPRRGGDTRVAAELSTSEVLRLRRALDTLKTRTSDASEIDAALKLVKSLQSTMSANVKSLAHIAEGTDERAAQRATDSLAELLDLSDQLRRAISLHDVSPAGSPRRSDTVRSSARITTNKSAQRYAGEDTHDRQSDYDAGEGRSRYRRRKKANTAETEQDEQSIFPLPPPPSATPKSPTSLVDLIDWDFNGNSISDIHSSDVPPPATTTAPILLPTAALFVDTADMHTVAGDTGDIHTVAGDTGDMFDARFEAVAEMWASASPSVELRNVRAVSGASAVSSSSPAVSLGGGMLGFNVTVPPATYTTTSQQSLVLLPHHDEDPSPWPSSLASMPTPLVPSEAVLSSSAAVSSSSAAVSSSSAAVSSSPATTSTLILNSFASNFSPPSRLIAEGASCHSNSWLPPAADGEGLTSVEVAEAGVGSDMQHEAGVGSDMQHGVVNDDVGRDGGVGQEEEEEVLSVPKVTPCSSDDPLAALWTHFSASEF